MMLNQSIQKQKYMQDYKTILVTGAAGFIGSHLIYKILNKNYNVIGIDSLNDYYDVNLKIDRLKNIGIDISTHEIGIAQQSTLYKNFIFYKCNLENQNLLEKIFSNNNPEIVINLAAQAGVRYSLTHPREYLKSNIDGFLNILECCRNYNLKHLLYASSSSVYGLNDTLPFKTTDSVDHPISLYASTKKSNELMAHTYSHLFNLPTTGLRFFTVYGPWGRPDMALFKFTKAIINNEPITLYNNGEMVRDFTYVEDIVESIFRLISHPPNKSEDQNLLLSPSTSTAPFRVLNVGNNNPTQLIKFLNELEIALNKKAIINNQPMQPGDVKATHADVKDLVKLIDFTPKTTTKFGINKFVEWYKFYYNV